MGEGGGGGINASGLVRDLDLKFYIFSFSWSGINAVTYCNSLYSLYLCFNAFQVLI